MQATIHNEFLTLTVDTHGAEAVSLKNAAGQEMLWQADPAVWKRHAPILFPWTGKLTGGAFTHKGKTYPGGQHGFARDVEHTLLCAEGDTIRLELRSDEKSKAERFPFDFVLTSTFRLEGRTVHHTLAVTNRLRVPLRPAGEPDDPGRLPQRSADRQVRLPVEERAEHPPDRRSV